MSIYVHVWKRAQKAFVFREKHWLPLLCAHAQHPGSALGLLTHSPYFPTPSQKMHYVKLSEVAPLAVMLLAKG